MFGKQGKPASIIPEISIVKWKEHIHDICISNKQNENLYKKKKKKAGLSGLEMPGF